MITDDKAIPTENPVGMAYVNLSIVFCHRWNKLGKPPNIHFHFHLQEEVPNT